MQCFPQTCYIVDQAHRHSTFIVTDEVYEHLVFDGAATFLSPGATGRTITISSAGKTFSTTGWKIGWVVAPADVIISSRRLRPAVEGDFYASIASNLQRKRTILIDGLQQAGFQVFSPAGAYYVLVDTAAVGFEDATQLARRLPELVGVVGVPVSAFVQPEHGAQYRSLLRFAFCKREDVLREAASAGGALSLVAVRRGGQDARRRVREPVRSYASPCRTRRGSVRARCR